MGDDCRPDLHVKARMADSGQELCAGTVGSHLPLAQHSETVVGWGGGANCLDATEGDFLSLLLQCSWFSCVT